MLEQVSMPELLMGMKKVKGMLEADPAKRTFGHLQR
jgi:linoleate 10R-lipoxygenase